MIDLLADSLIIGNSLSQFILNIKIKFYLLDFKILMFIRFPL
jgi:hypothetical protein